MRTLEYTVAVHWCKMPADEHLRKNLESGNRYLLCMIGETPWYRLLPKTCKCRKKITMAEASTLLQQGVANPIWISGRKAVEVDMTSIWMAQQRQVPRVDLISRADIERAYIDHMKSSMEYIEEVHLMYEENRRKLIVPFREDPQEGRLLFPFASDERTKS